MIKRSSFPCKYARATTYHYVQSSTIRDRRVICSFENFEKVNTEGMVYVGFSRPTEFKQLYFLHELKEEYRNLKFLTTDFANTNLKYGSAAAFAAEPQLFSATEKRGFELKLFRSLQQYAAGGFRPRSRLKILGANEKSGFCV